MKNYTLEEAKRHLKFECSYSRLQVFLDLYLGMQDRDVHQLLGDIWSICDNIGLHREELLYGPLSLSDETTLSDMMDEAEKTAFEELPDRIDIWRGCYAFNKRGLSWSLKREVADRFPFLGRYRQQEHRPLLIKAWVNKKSVIALKLDRDEAEIIANKVHIVSISTAKDPEGQFTWSSKENQIARLDA